MPVRVLLVGDAPGVAQALRSLPDGAVAGIVAASNRPQYHDELGRIASDRNVPLLVQPTWGSAEYPSFVRAASELQPRLILCNSYSMILRDDVLAIAPDRAINVHAGKVPQYRGPNPIQWSIIEDERDAGVTMHHMTRELDAGDVIAERRVPIFFEDTWRSVLLRLAEATEEMLRTEMPAVLAGTAGRRPQDGMSARTWPRRTPEDGRIDWSTSVLRIYNLVRALGDGIPPAFYESNGDRVVLDRYLTLGEVVALAYEPGSGRKRLALGEVELVPDGSDPVAFRVLRRGRDAGTCGIANFDAVRRTARIWVRPPDADALALISAFARDEFGSMLEASAT